MTSVIFGFAFALFPLALVPLYARGGSTPGEYWLAAGCWAIAVCAFFGIVGTFVDSADWNFASTAAMAIGFWVVWGPRVFKITENDEYGRRYRTVVTTVAGVLLVLAATDLLFSEVV